MLPLLLLLGQARAEGRYALLVGIDAYGSSPEERAGKLFGELQGAGNDVREMREVLERRGFEVEVLLDEQATGERIVSTFRSHLVRPDEEDYLALFYFSGHGQQVTDDDGDEVDGYDEALVPWDSAGVDDPSRHVRDDQLRELLGEVGQRTQDAIVVLDSCHSGTATRNAQARVRGRRPSGPPASSADRKTGFDAPTGARGYVLLSAARAEQPAVELELDGQVRGAFTYLFTRQLDQADPGTTWREVADRSRAQMRAIGLSQTPQVEGDADRALFGGDWTAGPTHFQARRGALEDLVIVEAGSLQGLQKGDLLSIHPADGSRAARITLRSVDLGQSTGTLAPGESLPRDTTIGLLAEIDQPKVSLYVPRVDVRDAPLRARRALEGLGGTAHVLEAGSSAEDADLVLAVEGDALVLRTGEVRVPIPQSCGAPPLDALPLDHEEFEELLVQAVALHRMRSRVQELDNPVAISRLDVGFEVHLVEAGPPSWEVTRDLGSVDGELGAGELFRFQVRNDSGVPVQVAVLELKADGGLQTALPNRFMGADETVIPVGGTWHSNVFQADDLEGAVGWKLVAVEVIDDGEPMEFRGLSRGVACRTNDKAAVSPLAALLQEAALSARSEPLGIEVEQRWGTDLLYADLVKEGR
ncbi:MAG: caspase family protein [Proteobacteria bacterium]|nr:caspase family protein [Pseudomonadota bacterium]MCP4917222.1 caspase family protein [Pseudomonadota bacterium]